MQVAKQMLLATADDTNATGVADGSSMTSRPNLPADGIVAAQWKDPPVVSKTQLRKATDQVKAAANASVNVFGLA